MTLRTMSRREWLWLPLAAGLPGCGYHLAGTADTIPKTIKTVAVVPFNNPTTRYRLTDRLPALIAREFLSRTRYQIVQNPAAADAILQGQVLSIVVFPTIFDPITNRAAGVEVVANLAIQLKERQTGKLLVNQPGFTMRQRYEISTDPAQYFDESTPAFQRLSVEVARRVVSAVLENF
jgi:hypothetical protein